MTQINDQDIDAKIAEWRANKDELARGKKFSAAINIITVLGWLLYFYKISQTPDYILQYSDEAHSSMGTWVLVLLLMSAACVAYVVALQRFKRRWLDLTSALTVSLRAGLSDANPGKRSKVESQLRELGA